MSSKLVSLHLNINSLLYQLASNFILLLSINFVQEIKHIRNHHDHLPPKINSLIYA